MSAGLCCFVFMRCACHDMLLEGRCRFKVSAALYTDLTSLVPTQQRHLVYWQASILRDLSLVCFYSDSVPDRRIVAEFKYAFLLVFFPRLPDIIAQRAFLPTTLFSRLWRDVTQ
jgi:hypothetical protein